MYWTREGKIKGVNLGRKRRFPMAEVEKILEGRS